MIGSSMGVAFFWGDVCFFPKQIPLGGCTFQFLLKVGSRVKKFELIYTHSLSRIRVGMRNGI